MIVTIMEEWLDTILECAGNHLEEGESCTVVNRQSFRRPIPATRKVQSGYKSASPKFRGKKHREALKGDNPNTVMRMVAFGLTLQAACLREGACLQRDPALATSSRSPLQFALPHTERSGHG